MTFSIEKLLRNLNATKAAGPDKLPSQVLKHCASHIAPILTIIFRHSIKTGILPSDWLAANVTAVYISTRRVISTKLKIIDLCP